MEHGQKRKLEFFDRETLQKYKATSITSGVEINISNLLAHRTSVI